MLQIRRLIAGVMFLCMVILGSMTYVQPVTASATYEGIAAIDDKQNDNLDSEMLDNTENSSDEESSEDEEVLGVQRSDSDKFILGLEVAISLTFAIGLIAAGRGVVSVETEERKKDGDEKKD